MLTQKDSENEFDSNVFKAISKTANALFKTQFLLPDLVEKARQGEPASHLQELCISTYAMDEKNRVSDIFDPSQALTVGFLQAIAGGCDTEIKKTAAVLEKHLEAQRASLLEAAISLVDDRLCDKPDVMLEYQLARCCAARAKNHTPHKHYSPERWNQRAYDALNRLLAIDSNDGRALHLMTQLTPPAKAQSYAQRLASLESDAPQPRVALLKACISQKKWLEAENHWHWLEEHAKDSPQTYVLGTQLALAQHQLDKAETRWQWLEEHAKDSPQTYVLGTQLALAQHKLDKAETRWQWLEKHDKKSPQTYVLGTQLALAQNQLDKAETRWQWLEEHAKDSPQTYVLGTQLALAQHQLDKAETRWQWLEEHAKDSPQTYVLGTQLALAQHKLDKAETRWQWLEKHDKKSPQTYVLGTQLALAQNQLDKAETRWQWLEEHHNAPQTYVLGTQLALAQQRPSLAQQCIKKLLSIAPEDVRCKALEIQVAMQEGDARKDWSRVQRLSEALLKQHPDNEVGVLFLSYARLRQGNLEPIMRDCCKKLDQGFHAPTMKLMQKCLSHGVGGPKDMAKYFSYAERYAGEIQKEPCPKYYDLNAIKPDIHTLCTALRDEEANVIGHVARSKLWHSDFTDLHEPKAISAQDAKATSYQKIASRR